MRQVWRFILIFFENKSTFITVLFNGKTILSPRSLFNLQPYGLCVTFYLMAQGIAEMVRKAVALLPLIADTSVK